MIFPSREWLAAVVAAANGHPDLPAALRGLPEDLAAVVEADPPALRSAFAVYGRQERGRIVTCRVLDDPDDILEIEPAYVFRAPYRVWKALLRGDDPVKAALSGRMRVDGDLEALVRQSSYRYVVEAALSGVATEFADDVGGSR